LRAKLNMPPVSAAVLHVIAGATCCAELSAAGRCGEGSVEEAADGGGDLAGGVSSAKWPVS
jgi:hypothetical protein